MGLYSKTLERGGRIKGNSSSKRVTRHGCVIRFTFYPHLDIFLCSVYVRYV